MLAGQLRAQQSLPTRDFSVSTNNRNEVLAFWHSIYMASEGYEKRVNWTGTYADDLGSEGTVGPEFIADIERRLNYFRAMAGLPADARVNTGSTAVIQTSDPYKPPANTLKSAASQRSALMIAQLAAIGSPDALNHNPSGSITWNSLAWNGHARSNLAFGSFGPGAVTAYMIEDIPGTDGILSIWNDNVGHRRWLLRTRSTDFATGDTPGTFNPDTNFIRRPTNAFYIVQNPHENADVPARFVPYPSAGYFPAPLVGRFWSLSRADTNFNKASVSVTDQQGNIVPTSIQHRNNLFGDPTIVWQMPVIENELINDITYQVTISNIAGIPSVTSHSYSVTLINPDRLSSFPTLIGTGHPHPETPATYHFTPPDQADALSLDTFTQKSASWVEDAEPSTPSFIIDRTADSYDLVTTGNFSGAAAHFSTIAGARSFRLTHPVWYDPLTNSLVDQIFELGREILPGSAAHLTFSFKRGYMTTHSKLVTEHSTDGGLTWARLGNVISGLGNSLINTTLQHSSPIPESDKPTLIRFRFYYGGNYASRDPFFADQAAGGFNWKIQPTGIFIDNIRVTKSQWLEPLKSNPLPPTAKTFVLDPSTSGGITVGKIYHLRMRTKLGGKWFPHGPLKALDPTNTPLIGFDAWKDYEVPILSGGFLDDEDGDGVVNGLEFAFFTDPLSPTVNNFATPVLDPETNTFSITHPLPETREGITYGAEWTENFIDWSEEGVTVTHHHGILSATITLHPEIQRFIRWRVSLN